ATTTVFSALRISVTDPVTTLAPVRTFRSGARTLRGSMLPAPTSGRKGAYVMYGRGSTTVIATSGPRVLRSSDAAVRPTEPPPRMRTWGLPPKVLVIRTD